MNALLRQRLSIAPPKSYTGGAILIYVQDDMPSKLLNISYVFSDTEMLSSLNNLTLRQCGY